MQLLQQDAPWWMNGVTLIVWSPLSFGLYTRHTSTTLQHLVNPCVSFPWFFLNAYLVRDSITVRDCPCPIQTQPKTTCTSAGARKKVQSRIKSNNPWTCFFAHIATEKKSCHSHLLLRTLWPTCDPLRSKSWEPWAIQSVCSWCWSAVSIISQNVPHIHSRAS